MRQHVNQAKGFTLIELLVVLVILGSLIGIAVLSVGIAGPGRELHNEAERLAGLIGVLAEEAVLDNQEYGLLLSREAYQVLRYDSTKQAWQALSNKPHQLPTWAQLSVELEGAALELPAAEGEEPSKTTLVPQLLLLSSGEISPFRLSLGERRADGLRLQLVSDGFQLPKVESEQPAGRRQ
ncbi:type II secretion system minor pseudopilin GspH [Pseudomonas leptonychotis]|uniref:type II secretion system minor pseudopilin GspH n=1 Tax=Pseudomonas leptonychotis TaxID=2448482 RepID=UPI0038637077